MFFCFASGRKLLCPKLFVRRCYIVKYCYRYLRICRCVPFKKYGDETGFDNRLNDEMLETPEGEAENFDEMSKSTVIPVHCSKWFRENKASFFSFRVHVITGHSSFYTVSSAIPTHKETTKSHIYFCRYLRSRTWRSLKERLVHDNKASTLAASEGFLLPC